MRSFLEVEGLYNPTLRFAFTNITNEEFVSYWDGVPIKVPAGETIEVSNVTPIPGAGHAIAVKMTGEMVDKIMIDEVKLEESRVNTPYYRSPKAGSLGVPAARKVWEDQILRELAPDEESPAIQSIRKQLLQELSNPNEKQTVEPIAIPTSIDAFAQIAENNQKIPEQPKAAAPVKRMGRPPKVKVEPNTPTV